MEDRIKETALEEVEKIKGLTTEAVKSRAYLYPIKGIYYFISHRSLWRPFLSKVTPTITTGISVTTFMFLVTYLPQAAVLALVNGPLAVVSAVPLVLSESSTITNLLARSFFIGDALVDTFDATLISRNTTDLVTEGRQVKPGGDPVAKLGKMLKLPFERFTPKAIIRYFIYLPLNFIPVVGTIMFVVLQGKKFGPTAHARYFQLKKMSRSQRQGFIEQRQAAYTSFGVLAVLLELIPFVGIVFAFTNVVGAALWASDMERQRMTAPNLQQQAEVVSKSE